MKLAILGGSFDPVHLGHLFIAEEARVSLGFDRVLFVPAGSPPHKDLSNMIPDRRRLELLRIALAGREDFQVIDWEMSRNAPSYTIETVRRVVEEFRPEGAPGLIIGDDLTEGFEKWREVDRLCEMVQLIVARRNGAIADSFEREHLRIDNIPLPVSSSQLRERIRNGRAYRYLVPEGVYSVIKQQGLYAQS